LQVGVEFLATAADGIDMQAGNEREERITAVAGLLGLQGGEPAALLLVEAADEEVNLVVEFAIGVILRALAVRAGTRVNRVVGHDESSGKGTRQAAEDIIGKVLEVILGRALIGFLLPAVQKARAAALRIQSMNKLKQIELATQGFSDTYDGNLPSINGMNNVTHNLEVTVLFSILPFLEQGNLYAAYTAQFARPGQTVVDSRYVLKPFLDSADPTLPSPPEGVSCYAASALVFAPRSRLAQLVDGTSNTIAYTQHYAFNCGGSEFTWAWDQADINYPPTPFGIVVFRRATFADKALGDVFPVTTAIPGGTIASVPGLTFQVNPKQGDCDPRIAQSPHNGLLVALCDGSVRSLAPGMSETTYWAAVTPNAGDILGPDW
jgi:hypothetical protein